MRNEKLNTKEKRLLYILFFYISYLIFPLFADITRIPNYIPAIAVVLYVYIFHNDCLSSKALKSFYYYIIALLLLGMVGHRVYINGLSFDTPFLWAITIETAWMLPSLLIMNVIVRLNNFRIYKYLGVGTLLLLIISFLYILPMLMSSVAYLRSSSSFGDESSRPMGVPGYALMHAYTLVLVPLAWIVKSSKGSKQLIFILATLLFFYIVVQTAVSTSLVIAIFIFVFVLLMNPNNISISIVGWTIVGVSFIVLYYMGFFLDVVDALMPFFEDTPVEAKLVDLHNSMVAGHITGDNLTVRMDVQNRSMHHFFENPLFGSNDLPGAHSKIWDVLGTMGLLAGVPFLLVIWNSMKQWSNVAENKITRIYVVFSLFIGCIYLYTKGIFSGEGWLFMIVIVPCIIIWYSQQSIMVKKGRNQINSVI